MSTLRNILSRLAETANPLTEIPYEFKGGSFKALTDSKFQTKKIKAGTAFKLSYSWGAGSGRKISLTLKMTGQKDFVVSGTVKQLTTLVKPIILASKRL